MEREIKERKNKKELEKRYDWQIPQAFASASPEKRRIGERLTAL
jgi:hypothetical protein